jgi:hypothetical protein
MAHPYFTSNSASSSSVGVPVRPRPLSRFLCLLLAAVTLVVYLRMAESQSNATLADALRSQIALYQAGLPFRDTCLANGASGQSQP